MTEPILFLKLHSYNFYILSYLEALVSVKPDSDMNTEDVEYNKIRSIVKPTTFLPLILVIWLVGGVVPLVAFQANNVLLANDIVLFQIDWEVLSNIGDVFGAANALFAGGALLTAVFALLAQIEELRLTRKEQRDLIKANQEQAVLQASRLSAEATMPIFLRTRDSDVGTALGVLANQWRKAAEDELGVDPILIINQLKSEQTRTEARAMIDAVNGRLTKKFADLRQLAKRQDQGGEIKEFVKWDKARREVSTIAQQVHQLAQSGIITDDKFLRASAFPDFVATYKYYVYPIDLSIERERRPKAETYPPGWTFISLYGEEELVDAIY